MGFCYQGKLLCCDHCGHAGGVRKMRCPFGYCPSVAFCAECRKNKKDYLSKAKHREMGCEVAHAKFILMVAADAAKRAAGEKAYYSNTTRNDRCAHCGQAGETAGHQTCQYPQDMA